MGAPGIWRVETRGASWHPTVASAARQPLAQAAARHKMVSSAQAENLTPDSSPRPWKAHIVGRWRRWVRMFSLAQYVCENKGKVKGLTFFTFESLNGSTVISKMKKEKKPR